MPVHVTGHDGDAKFWLDPEIELAMSHDIAQHELNTVRNIIEEHSMTQNEINQHEWENRDNWKWGEFYHCDKDSRVWVPKKPQWMGWTLNFSKKQSYAWLFFIAGIPLVLLILFANKI